MSEGVERDAAAGGGEDVADEVAGGARSAVPCGRMRGLPVYRWGQAPEHLRTRTQLAEERLKLGPEQEPVGWLWIQRHGHFELYDPAGAVKMRPLGSRQKAAREARRTCPECGEVRGYVVRERCEVCRERAVRERRRREARTCWGCREVFPRALRSRDGRCAGCRSRRREELRRAAAEWVERVTVCAGEGCAVRIVTKSAARSEVRRQGLRWGSWSVPSSWARWCGPCEAEALRLMEERRVAREREARERREAEARAAVERVRWAAEALADDRVVVLDTETTGLGEDARIVELAVVSSAGEVVLNTLVDPGEPIPAEATAVHGISSEDVAGAPSFDEVLTELTCAVDWRRVLIYNAPYDVGRLRYELELAYAARGPLDGFASGASEAERRREAEEEGRRQAAAWLDSVTVEDVMIPYSAWVGEWSESHGGYRWQRLNGGHRAVGDCRAVLECLRAMARDHVPEAENSAATSSESPAAAAASVEESAGLVVIGVD